MEKGRKLWCRMIEGTSPVESVSCQTIVEIAGERRVLIENHHGVVSYGNEKIMVKSKSGTVSVCGNNLEIVCMSREQIVIFGEIQHVSLHGREII